MLTGDNHSPFSPSVTVGNDAPDPTKLDSFFASLENNLESIQESLSLVQVEDAQVEDVQVEDAQVEDAHANELGHEDEMDRMAHALSLKFEELSLIRQLSEQAKLGEDSDEMCQSLLDELEHCIVASTIAIDLYEDEEYQCCERIFQTGQVRENSWLLSVADNAFQVTEQLNWSQDGNRRVAILNDPEATGLAHVRVVVVPIQRDEKRLGRMIAIRPMEEEEFGTIEADLMKSTSMILAAHIVNQRQYHEMQQMFEGTVQSLVSALDAKDAYTCGHSSRVADLAVELAGRLGFSEDGINRLRMAGMLHDIGKIGIEDSVLRKPGRLTEDEFEKIKEHPVLGYEILRGIRPFRNILPAVRHHHESWDGTGYPDGLAGEEIPRDAQVLAVADAFDAMTSDRPYRDGMPLDKVVGIFREGQGIQWASDVVDALLSCPDTMLAFSQRQDSETATLSESAEWD